MKLFFAGDIVKFDETDFLMDSALTDVVKSADYAVANLEAPCFSQEFRKIPKRGPHLSQSPRVLKLLKEAGFTHCSLANNHIMDYGFDGLRETLAGMDKLGVVSYGANPAADSVYKPVFLEKDGTTVALCSLAEGGFGMSLAPAGGYAWVNAPEVGYMLEEAKKADFCIFSIHAGLENCDFPLPEWRQIYRTLCEKGVDVVIGHHPHVPQGCECWKNSLIFYSLGNFYFNGMMMSEKNDSAYSVFLELEKGKKITYSCCQHEQKNNRTCLTGTGFQDGLNEILTRTVRSGILSG